MKLTNQLKPVDKNSLLDVNVLVRIVYITYYHLCTFFTTSQTANQVFISLRSKKLIVGQLYSAFQTAKCKYISAEKSNLIVRSGFV